MSQATSYKVLESVPPNSGSSFSKSVNEGYKVLCDLSPCQKYPPGVELFAQGARAQHIYFIERGLVKLTSLCENGREVVVCLRSEDQMIGTSSVILQQSYSLQATT